MNEKSNFYIEKLEMYLRVRNILKKNVTRNKARSM